jgi:hypothetical protein
VKGRCALVVNTRSHLVSRKGSRLETLAGKDTSLPLVHFEASSKFDEAIGRLVQEGCDTFLIEGGDGTVLAVLTACYNFDPACLSRLRFGILAGGSTNLAHERLGLRRPTVDKLARLASATEALACAPPVLTSQPALIVEADGLPRPLVGFLLSTGALALAMDHVQHHMFGSGRRGPAAIASSLVKLVARPHHYLAEDGEPLLRPSRFSPGEGGRCLPDGAHGFLLASTLDRLSLGLSPFWGDTEEGALQVTYAPWPLKRLRPALLRVATGYGLSSLEARGYRSFASDAFDFTVHSPLMLDGELLALDQPTSVRVKTTGDLQWIR